MFHRVYDLPFIASMDGYCVAFGHLEKEVFPKPLHCTRIEFFSNCVSSLFRRPRINLEQSNDDKTRQQTERRDGRNLFQNQVTTISSLLNFHRQGERCFSFHNETYVANVLFLATGAARSIHLEGLSLG